MSQVSDILKLIDRLSASERAELEAQLAQRLESGGGRQRVVADVRNARAELPSGKAKRATVDEIVDEIDL